MSLGRLLTATMMLVVGIGLSSQGFAQETPVRTWRALPSDMQDFAAAMFMNGFIMGIAATSNWVPERMGSQGQVMIDLNLQAGQCFSGWDGRQAGAVIRRYLDQRPEVWHESFSLHAAMALLEVIERCLRFPRDSPIQ